MALMKIVCAWCEKDMGDVQVEAPTDLASSGICRECHIKHFPETAKKTKDLIPGVLPFKWDEKKVS